MVPKAIGSQLGAQHYHFRRNKKKSKKIKSHSSKNHVLSLKTNDRSTCVFGWPQLLKIHKIYKSKQK